MTWGGPEVLLGLWGLPLLGLLMAVTFCCETVAQAQEKKSPVFVDEDGDGIYEVTLTLKPATYEFKYINGNIA